jgi:hypothetical protein
MQKAGGNAKLRGFSSNVSNYNPYQTNNPPSYTAGSGNELRARGLPTNFIIDQGRVGVGRVVQRLAGRVRPAVHDQHQQPRRGRHRLGEARRRVRRPVRHVGRACCWHLV